MNLHRINRWKPLLAVAALPLTLAASAQGEGLPRSGWPKSQADAGNTGAAPRTGSGQGKSAQGKSAQGKLKWRVKSGTSSDVVVGPNGIVYTGGANAPHTFAAETGLPLSPFKFEVSVDDAGIPSKPGYGPSNYHRPVQAADGSLHITRYYTPALAADRTLFVSGDSGYIYAVDGQTGRKLWKFAATAPCFSSPTIGTDGTVYAGCQDFEVYALDSATGRKRWGFRAGDRIEGTPVLGLGTGQMALVTIDPSKPYDQSHVNSNINQITLVYYHVLGWRKNSNFVIKRINSIAQTLRSPAPSLIEQREFDPTHPGAPIANGPTDPAVTEKGFLTDGCYVVSPTGSGSFAGAYWGNADARGVELRGLSGGWTSWTDDPTITMKAGAYPNAYNNPSCVSKLQLILS